MMKARSTERLVLAVVSLSSFMTAFMASSVNIALPAIGREFLMDAVLLNWVASAYLLPTAMFLLPMGRLADIRGRKRIFLLGLSIFSLTSLALAFSTQPSWLLALRGVQGIGCAMIFGTAMAILTSVWPAQRRGFALGINIGTVYLGLTLGPVLGGLLTDHLGWRSIFWSGAALGGVLLVLTLRHIRGEWADSRGERFDVLGSGIYALSLLSLMYGLSLLPERQGLSLVVLGLGGLMVFILWENRVAHPVFDVRLFMGNRLFVFSNLTAMIHYSATFAVVFLLSLYLQYIRGLSAQAAGLILMAQPVVMALLTPVTGHLSDRIEPRLLASGGMGVTAGGLFWLTALRQDSPLPMLVFILILLGAGYALFSSPNTNAVMSSVQQKSYGVASSILATMRMCGQMFSMGVVMLVFALCIGREPITPANAPAFMQSLMLACWLFALLSGAGIFFSLVRGRVHPGAIHPPPRAQ